MPHHSSDDMDDQPPSPQRQGKLEATLTQFWRQQMADVDAIRPGPDCAELRNHPLPLARIKKIMKSDEDVRMISAEAPVLFAKACELFILELTLRAWTHSEDNKRRTLQRNDVGAAIAEVDILDFLLDIVPREDMPEGSAAASGPSAAPQPAGGTAQAMQHQQVMYSMPGGGVVTVPAHMVGQPGAQPQQGIQYMPWPGGLQEGVPAAMGPQMGGGDGSGMSMDPKMQAHMAQQMAAAQQQYMTRQMQRPQQVHLPQHPGQPQQRPPMQ